MSVPTQPQGQGSESPAPGADPTNGGTPPATPPAPSEPQVDFAKLPADQLTKVLENPEFWNIPRVKELREQAAEAKKLREAQAKAGDEKLKEDKKFEELASKYESENQTLKDQIQKSSIDNALMGKLAGESVVDLDGALKLIDRSKISVDDSGSVTGVEDAINSLKTDKAYLFGTQQPPKVGSPSNPSGGQAPSGPSTFKRSQLTQEFINANKDAVYAAMHAGQIEDDGPPPSQ